MWNFLQGLDQDKWMINFAGKLAGHCMYTSDLTAGSVARGVETKCAVEPKNYLKQRMYLHAVQGCAKCDKKNMEHKHHWNRT